MNKNFIILFLSLFICISNPAFAKQKEIKTPNDLIQFVHQAAKLVQDKGEAAFEEFNKKESKWYHDNTYICVYAPTGTRIVYPPHPDQIGEHVPDLKDRNGKPIVQWLLEIGENPQKPFGWFYYEWPKPNATEPSWKSAYGAKVVTPQGKTYFIHSGIYDMKLGKPQIEELVNEAASLIKQKGEAALPVFHDKSGKFLFSDKYFFICRPDGTELINAAKPELEGKNMLEYPSQNIQKVYTKILNAVKDKDTAWIEYKWAKPGEEKLVRKVAYLKKVSSGGKTFILGCGLY